jgi:hypothetical protein
VGARKTNKENKDSKENMENKENKENTESTDGTREKSMDIKRNVERGAWNGRREM